MKKTTALAAAMAALLLGLTACAVPANSQTSVSAAPSRPAGSASLPETPPGPPQSAALPADATGQGPPAQLTMYDNIEDVPGGDYSISALDTEYDRPGEIFKNGQPWGGPPGDSKFENPVFADSNHLYVRAVWPGGDYQWYYFDWEMADTSDILIPDSQNKMFVGVDGTRLLCEDGEAFDTGSWEWTA